MADLNIGLTLRNHATSVTGISWNRVGIGDLQILAHEAMGDRPVLDRDIDRLGSFFIALADLAREMAADLSAPQHYAEHLLPHLVRGTTTAWIDFAEEQAQLEGDV